MESIKEIDLEYDFVLRSQIDCIYMIEKKPTFSEAIKLCQKVAMLEDRKIEALRLKQELKNKQAQTGKNKGDKV